MRRQRRRGGLVAVLVAVALAVAGCGGLPTPTGVKVVRTVAGAVDDTGDDVRVLPPGPAADADPEHIVDGFLNAVASSGEDDYAIAREYLAPGATWSTAGTTVVYQSPTSAVHLAANGASATVSSTLSVVATVDARGVYLPQDRDQADSYSLTKVRGAWRISALPAGLRLTAGGLDRTFIVSTLWWFTPDGRRLVPDLRWLPAGQTTGRPTQLVRSLLAGPSAALSGAVRSAAPSDATLVGSVAADGSDATVDLSQQAAALTATQAQSLLVQLAATLQQVTSVTGVRLLVDGQPLPAAGDPRRIAVADAAAYEPVGGPVAPTLVAGGGRVTVLGAGPALPTAVVVALAHRTVTRAVPSPDGTAVAAVADGEVVVVRPDGAVQPIVAVPDAALSWTQDGRLAVGLPTKLELVAPDGSKADILYPAGVPGPVDDVRIARDGVRVAYVSGSAGHRRAWLAALSGKVLAAPVAMAPELPDVTQVAWQDATDLDLVSAPAGQPPALVMIAADGSQPDPLDLPSAVGRTVELAAGPGVQVVVGGAGTVDELTGENTWRRVAGAGVPGVA